MRDSFTDILAMVANGSIQKRAVSNQSVLNKAYAYAKPSSLSRGVRIDFGHLTILLISGTASIDEYGDNVHLGACAPKRGAPSITSQACLPQRVRRGKMSSAPRVTCAISIAATRLSTKSARHFMRN